MVDSVSYQDLSCNTNQQEAGLNPVRILLEVFIVLGKKNRNKGGKNWREDSEQLGSRLLGLLCHSHFITRD